MTQEITIEWCHVLSMMQSESPKLPKYQPITIYPTDPPEIRQRFQQWNKSVKRWDMSRTTMLVGRKGVYAANTKAIANNGNPFWAIPPIEGKVLDLGCNIGSFGFSGLLYALAEGRKFQYFGVDTDHTCVDFAGWLKVARGIGNEMIFCQGDADEVARGFFPVKDRFNVVIFLATYHHIFGLKGAETARALIDYISGLSPVMYFETATKGEPCNPDRAYWWEALPKADDYNRWVKEEVIEHSAYNAVKEVGVSHVGSEHTRILYRFTREA